MINADFEVQITPALVKLNRIAGRFNNFEPVMGGRLDVAVRDFFRRRFESEGRVGGGGRWKKLTTSYSSFKRSRGGRRRILQLSGKMMEAYSKRNAEHQIIRTGKDFYELSVDETIAPRVAGHTRGNPRFKLPKRPIKPRTYPKSFIEELRQAVKGYVIRGET